MMFFENYFVTKTSAIISKFNYLSVENAHKCPSIILLGNTPLISYIIDDIDFFNSV
jgi:hypothetical protein